MTGMFVFVWHFAHVPACANVRSYIRVCMHVCVCTVLGGVRVVCVVGGCDYPRSDSTAPAHDGGVDPGVVLDHGALHNGRPLQSDT